MSGLRMLMYIPLAEKVIPTSLRLSQQALDMLFQHIQGNPAAEVERYVSGVICMCIWRHGWVGDRIVYGYLDSQRAYTV